MRIVTPDSVPLLPNPHGAKACRLHDSPHAQVMHISLSPGQSLAKHSTPVDVVFYILEGRGIVEIGDESAAVVADTLIESPANTPHRLINDGNSDLRFLVTRTPRPTEA
jgi:mannose-6-phosphate isomerase-like protein (cupin superfamily)